MKKAFISIIYILLSALVSNGQSKILVEKTYVSTTDSTASLESTNQAVFSQFLLIIQKDSVTYTTRQVMKKDRLNGGYLKTFCIVLPANKKEYVISLFERLYPFPKNGTGL